MSELRIGAVAADRRGEVQAFRFTWGEDRFAYQRDQAGQWQIERENGKPFSPYVVTERVLATMRGAGAVSLPPEDINLGRLQQSLRSQFIQQAPNAAVQP